MEEEEGFRDRAMELRNYRMQSRVELVKPEKFMVTPDQATTPRPIPGIGLVRPSSLF